MFKKAQVEIQSDPIYDSIEIRKKKGSVDSIAFG